MSRVVVQPGSTSPFQSAALKRWAPSAAIWGIGLGTAALLFLQVTPKVKREFLVNVPILGHYYYEDKTPPSDKPF